MGDKDSGFIEDGVSDDQLDSDMEAMIWEAAKESMVRKGAVEDSQALKSSLEGEPREEDQSMGSSQVDSRWNLSAFEDGCKYVDVDDEDYVDDLPENFDLSAVQKNRKKADQC